MRVPVSTLLAMALLASCQAAAPTGGKPATPRPAGPKGQASVAPGVTSAGSSAPGQPGPAGVVGGVPRPVAPGDALVQLAGKVKQLSDQGAGVVSNNGAGGISNNGAGNVSNNGGGIGSNNGGGIVSNNGGGIISDKGGGVVSDGGGRYHLRQAAAPAEWLLADARIEVLDARKRVLVGPDGQPIGGVTDKGGNYAFSANLPDENLILRIKLWQGGELAAFLTRGSREVVIDTASTLGAAYVLAEYVKERQDVLDLLPAKEAEELHADLEAARGQLPGVPAYRPAEMVQATADLRAKASAVDAILERIEAILLVGQKELGAGLVATDVPIARPAGAYRDARGNLYVAEEFGRIRRIDPQGRVHLYAGVGAAPETGVVDLPGVQSMAGRPDGTLFLYDGDGARVLRIDPGGPMTVLAGGRDRAAGIALEGRYNVLSATPDGGILVPSYGPAGNHVHRLGPDGRWTTVAPPPTTDGYLLTAVAEGGAGMYALEQEEEAPKAATRLWRRAEDGAWTPLTPPEGWLWHNIGKLAVTDRGAYVAGRPVSRDAVGLIRVAPDGTSELAWGEQKGPLVDGAPARTTRAPSIVGLAATPSGGVLASAVDLRRVVEIDAGGVLRFLAGADPEAPIRPGQAVPVNGPAGLAFDPDGRLVVAESAGGLLRRLEGDRLATFVGGGMKGTEAPPLESLLLSPIAVGFAGPTCYFLDSTGRVLRRLSPEGPVAYAVGRHISFGPGRNDGRTFPAAEYGLVRPTALAIDPQGRPVFADAGSHAVARLNADGHVEVLAGATSGSTDGRAGDVGDDGPATDARLNAPAGLAYDRAGNLYVADSLNGRIRRIRTDGVIETFAGVPLGEGFARLSTGALDAGEVPAREALLVAPSALCFDAAGNLYVAELGTTLASKLGSAAALFETLPRVAASIRKITPDGRASLVAGRGARALAGHDGGDALVAPGGLAIDRDGNLVVADSAAGLVYQVPREALE